jgi:cell division protein FtsB
LCFGSKCIVLKLLKVQADIQEEEAAAAAELSALRAKAKDLERQVPQFVALSLASFPDSSRAGR